VKIFYESRRDLIRLAFPLYLQYLCESIVMILDIFFISRLGSPAIAARGTASYVIFLISAPVSGALLASYTTVLSQTNALGDRRLLNECFRKLLTISLAASGLLVVLYYTLGPGIVGLICPDKTIDRLALRYIFGGYIYGIPGLLLFIQYLSLLYGRGRTREAFISWTVSDVIYVICDPLLIFFLGLGIAGSGLAFTLSLYLVLPLMHYLNSDLGDILKIDTRISRNILSALSNVGLFVFFERLTLSALYSAYCGVIARYGDTIYTAYQLGLTLESFVYMPILAFRDVSNIVTGHVAVKDRTNIGNVYKRLIETALIMTLPLAIMLITLSPLVTRLFTDNTAIAKLASIYLTISVISDIGHAVTWAEIGAFQGTGNAVYAFIADTLTMALTRVLPAFLLASLHVNIIYVWMLMDLDAITRGIILYTIFRKYISERRIRVFI